MWEDDKLQIHPNWLQVFFKKLHMEAQSIPEVLAEVTSCCEDENCKNQIL